MENSQRVEENKIQHYERKVNIMTEEQISEECISEERIMQNTNFTDEVVDTAISLVFHVDKALMNFTCENDQKLTIEKRREYLPLVLDLIHRSNTRDDARSNRRLHAGALGMGGFPESDCDL
jgi:hypothetical protein